MFRTFLLALAVIATTPSALAQTVSVAEGDSLSKIAAKTLGDAARWVELCQANSDVLRGNCDLVVVGTVLALPKASGTAETDQSPTETPSGAVLSVTQLTPEHLAIAPAAITFGDAPAIELTALKAEGAKRVAYMIDLSDVKRATVFWSFRTADAANATLVLFSGSRGGTYGTVELRLADQLSVSSAGAVEEVEATSENEWTTLKFSFDVAAGQRDTQVIIYPAGVSDEQPSAAVTLVATSPTAKREE